MDPNEQLQQRYDQRVLGCLLPTQMGQSRLSLFGIPKDVITKAMITMVRLDGRRWEGAEVVPNVAAANQDFEASFRLAA